MGRYKLASRGGVIGIYVADDPRHALDVMCRACGLDSWAYARKLAGMPVAAWTTSPRIWAYDDAVDVLVTEAPHATPTLDHARLAARQDGAP